MKTRRLLAADFGASGGRVVLGEWDGRYIKATELHRFANEPVSAIGHLYWDALHLFHELKQGMSKARTFDSISVDTWGVDFALLDRSGALLQNPVHYRDNRTNGMMKEIFKDISKQRLYEITGNQLMEINTLYQLRALQVHQPYLLEQASKVLMMPDFFSYLLSGTAFAECSTASTTQLLDISARTWSSEILQAIPLSNTLLPDIVPSGTSAGPLLSSLQGELSLNKAQVIAGAGHDTQSAMAAVPSSADGFAFISSGTWSLMGTESDFPITDKTAFSLNMTNECDVGGKVSFLKNITGLWLIQESRRQWKRDGKDYSYHDLEKLAKSSTAPVSLIDVDDPAFTPAGDLPGRVREYCRHTGQPVPTETGDVIRCIYYSLALKYRKTFIELQSCTGKRYPQLHIVGGGVKDGYLCQLTADACGVPVLAGPAEATVLGNLGIQLVALRELHSLSELRSAVSLSIETAEYHPADTGFWNYLYHQYEVLIKR